MNIQVIDFKTNWSPNIPQDFPQSVFEKPPFPPKEKQRPIYDSSLMTNSFVQIAKNVFEDLKKTNKIPIKNTDQLSPRTIKILGENGITRFEVFKKYSEGWDGGHALPLSHRSTAVMESFINQFFEFHKEPSLFLTPDGNLQLGWENSQGQSIELEFYPNKIEYYIERSSEEGQTSLEETNINWLISELRENE